MEDKRNATQKIEDLEKVVTMLYQATAQIKNVTESLLPLRGDMSLVKDALKLLNKKTEAIIQVATAETGITVDSVSALVVKMSVEDLTAQVAGYVANGHLTPSDTVDAKSYLVCEELAQDGTVANPRIQFRLDSQDQATAEALTGKKVGDTVSFGENKFSAKILEIYAVTEPKPPEVTSEEAPAAEVAPATEGAAPATEASSSPVASTSTGPSNEALGLPEESPVTEFVPSQSGTMATA